MLNIFNNTLLHTNSSGMKVTIKCLLPNKLFLIKMSACVDNAPIWVKFKFANLIFKIKRINEIGENIITKKKINICLIKFKMTPILKRVVFFDINIFSVKIILSSRL